MAFWAPYYLISRTILVCIWLWHLHQERHRLKALQDEAFDKEVNQYTLAFILCVMPGPGDLALLGLLGYIIMEIPTWFITWWINR